MFFGFFKKKEQSTQDRRQEVRYEAEDEFLVEFQERGSHYLGNSRDISMSGIRFATTTKMKLNETIVLNFRLPQEFSGIKHFSVKGKVVRIYKPAGATRYRVGCSLKHENESTKELLREFIYWLEHRSVRR